MRLTFWLLAVAVTTLGCKAKVGEKCSGAGVCDGRSAALLCDPSFKYVGATCKGPDGCTDSPFRCDFLGNAKGDPCSDLTEGHPMRCTADKKARLRCVDGKVDRDECDGPQGCFPKNETTMGCDRAFKAGSPCSSEGDWCSDDRKERLTCAAGKLVVAGKCRGPRGCKSLDGLIACDVSLAELGDACTLDATACSVDGTKLLACREGKFQLEKACSAGNPCAISSGRAGCPTK